jgi:poly-gamma-glutamate synthesis protein (capsule biosynthesis protein)
MHRVPIYLLGVLIILAVLWFQWPRIGSSNKIQETTSVLFVGDIMMGRNVELLMDQKGDQYPFEYISSLFSSVDAVIANLEGPIIKDHTRTPLQSLMFNFDSGTPQLLKSHNVQVVSLANNHTYDYGKAGYDETTTFLADAGITAVGHPFAFGQEFVVRKQIGSQNMVFVAFNITNPHFRFDKALAFVKTIQKNPDEKLMAMVHGGDEYQLISNPIQKSFYQGLIDSGADLVIAHHPHVVEEIEQYHGKIIFYSLGNFIFDQYFSKQTQQGLTVRATFTSGTTTLELIPLKSILSQPMLMNEKEKATFLQSLADRSSKNIQSAIRTGTLEVL